LKADANTLYIHLSRMDETCVRYYTRSVDSISDLYQMHPLHDRLSACLNDRRVTCLRKIS